MRTGASGVCHSDLHFVEGLYTTPMPCILGHEAAGVVEAVGEQVSYVRPGDSVISCLSVFCGTCEFCTRGQPYLCDRTAVTRRRDDPPRLRKDGESITQFAQLGSYAAEMLVHENALVKVDDALAGALRIIAIDTTEDKLGLAREFGATDVIDATAGNVAERIMDLTDGGVDYSFEAIGLKQTAEDCYNMLRPGGMATIIGMVPEGVKIELDAGNFLRRGRAIQGCTMGSNRFRTDMPRYIEFYKQGRLKLDELVTQELALSEINKAFADMKAQSVRRSVITDFDN